MAFDMDSLCHYYSEIYKYKKVLCSKREVVSMAMPTLAGVDGNECKENGGVVRKVYRAES